MIHVIRKAFFDFEKEERFLNAMSAKGLALKNYSWCKYVFEDAPKGEYIYRLELLENPIEHPESQEYISFMKDMGAELVASYHRWCYFRKKAADGEFTIYSDVDSKIQHYNRIRFLFVVITALNFFVGVYNFYIGNVSITNDFPPINTLMSIISFTVAALLLIFILLPLSKKIEILKKEKEIHE